MKINLKRLLMTIAAVFVTVFLTDFFIHGKILAQTYMDTAHLWRDHEEMQGYMGWMFLGQLTISAFFSVIFAKGYQKKGWMEGVRYGLLMAGFTSGHFFITYSTTPLPSSLLAAWVAAALVQGTLAGVVASLVYKK